MKKITFGIIVAAVVFVLVGTFCFLVEWYLVKGLQARKMDFTQHIHKTESELESKRKDIKDEKLLMEYDQKVLEIKSTQQNLLKVVSLNKVIFSVYTLLISFGLICVLTGIGLLFLKEKARQAVMIASVLLSISLLALANWLVWLVDRIANMVICSLREHL